MGLTNGIYRGPSFDVVPVEKYDLVTAWHCIEHLGDPVSFLEKLKPYIGKYLLVAVPNYSSIGQKLMGRHWIWLQQPYVHIWHFSPENIHIPFEQARFEILKLNTKDTWDAQLFFDVFVTSALLVFKKLLEKLTGIISCWKNFYA